MGAFLDKPKTEKHNAHGAGNGLRYGLSSMQGWRVEMEDAHTAVVGIPHGLEDWSFFAVYDGHAGSRVANYCSTHLLEHITTNEDFRAAGKSGSALEPSVENVKNGIRTGFLKIDEYMRNFSDLRNGMDRSGSTAVGVMISPKHVYFINCGDSRAVLYRNGQVCFSTQDHKPCNPREKERIQNAGGSVMIQRVNGSLAVSRALGDYDYKCVDGKGPTEQLVSPEPEVYEILRAEEDEFIILACDGIWDVMSNEELCEFVKSRLEVSDDLENVCNWVVDTCLHKGSRDNMSIVLVCFSNAPKVSDEAVKKDSELDKHLESRVEEIMEKSGEEGMPDLAHVMRILSAENIPNLPPGGGLAGKRNVIEAVYSRLNPHRESDGVHDSCRRRFSKECCCGSHRSSVIPPTALSDPKGNGQLVVSPDFWNLDWSSACSCPLLIFINSKSGDHQGIVFLRKFKQYLNPSQVFDLSKGGPEAGLCMFKNFARFRVLVCGGDGSVSWVLSLMDAFGLHDRCQLAVIPLGTGNDLARVLGWGAFWSKNESPLDILNRVEQASVRILDRWSVMIRETPKQSPLPKGQVEMDIPQFEAAAIQHLESASTELNKILKAKYPTEMIIATRFLCSAVEDFVADIVKAWSRIKQNNTAIESVILKSDLMFDKLSVLIDVLSEDASATSVKKGTTVYADSGKADGKPFIPQMDHIAKSKLELATKAQNLQKSLKLIIFQVEQVLDEESRQTLSVKNFTSTSTFLLEEDSESISQTSPRHHSRCRGTLSSISSLQSEDLDNLDLEHLHFTPETLRFKEKCVMNNYFGIGLDAKISLEFNTRRDEHPGQHNSRLKNKIWYGLLGSKELLQRSYRKLEERVRLECDGEVISLPNLQGIVVLNITSYAGGINFWGSNTATTEYEAPAIDDGKLEVVAIFGSVQMAMSRIINLHHHRIAQCHEVKITIEGEEGIPVQVDGEAWVQRPGLIKIKYKNAAQMLMRDRDFENSMKTWECKHTEIQAALQPQLGSQESQDSLSDEEHAQMQHLAQLAENLISRLNDLSKVHQHVSVLMDSVNASANILNDVFYGQDSSNEAGAASCTPIETLSRNDAVDVTFSLKGLYNDTKAFLDENLLRNAEDKATLQAALDAMNEQFEKLSEIDWMCPILAPEEKSSDMDSRSLRLKGQFPKLGKKKLEEEDRRKSGQGIQGFFGSLWHRRNREHQATDDEPPAPSRFLL